MNFDSIFFIGIFLPLLVILYRLLPGEKSRNWLLLFAGLFFYAFGSLTGLGLLIGVAFVNYLLGIWIQKGRKIPCVLAVVFNLVFLCLFKYANFFLTELLGLPKWDMGIVAPLGISFFVFKCISYAVDTYRDPKQGTKRFSELLLYISFFPQVVAGPISRFSQFSLTGRTDDIRVTAQGLRRFVAGLGKKVILAGASATIVDRIFAMEAPDIRLAWLGAIAYMVQIYFDFSGYSDMAIGLGNAFGFVTPENFRYPYGAKSLSDFWRRWHISLSSWFKDYLYIPLGGNRKGAYRTALNKIIVFALCGIWHGANWTFLLWGLWHGLLTALESLNGIRLKGKILPRIYTLLAVCLGFVMFRAETVAQGFSFIAAMFAGFSVTPVGTVELFRLLTGESIFLLILGAILSLPVAPRLKEKYSRIEPLSFAGSILLFVYCLMQLASGGFTPFIYAQF